MTIVFNNVRLSIRGKFFPGQKVLVENGKISTVGSNIVRRDIERIVDCEQSYLIPGLIDAHTHLGLAEVGDDLSDITDMGRPITPHLRPLDGIRMHGDALQQARQAGITTCMVCPGADLPISGVCSILKTNGNSADVGLIIEQAGILFSFGELPKRQAKKFKSELHTRMGLHALIRETLMKAQDYYAAKQNKKLVKDREIDMEALIPLIKGEVPMRVVAHRAEDILAAIRIAEEFELKIVIEHATEAHLIADKLAEKEIPVVLGPTLIPELRHELNERTFESAKILSDAGVLVALTCDYPGLPIETLRVAAAMAVQYGLDEDKAIAMITTNPAQILGVGDRLGKIRRGYDADLVLFSGHPLDLRSKLLAMIIDGELLVISDELSIETRTED
jgi:imidazolonepropionase-like amidohydrolase